MRGYKKFKEKALDRIVRIRFGWSCGPVVDGTRSEWVMYLFNEWYRRWMGYVRDEWVRYVTNEGSRWWNMDVRVQLLLLSLILLLLLTAIELSLGGSSPYTSTDKTNKNKYT